MSWKVPAISGILMFIATQLVNYGNSQPDLTKYVFWAVGYGLMAVTLYLVQQGVITLLKK
jgi:hypothetical protein